MGGVLLAAWSAACLTTLILLVGARWLRYSRWSTAPGLDDVLREMMVIEQQALLWPLVYDILAFRSILLALALPVLGLHRRLRSRLVTQVDGVWHLTPVTVAILLGAMVWLHYLFDLNPTVTVVCGTSLVLAAFTGHPRVASALPPVVSLAVWGAFFVYWLVAAGDPTERLTIAVWAVVLLTTHRYLAALLARRDLALMRAVAVMPMNLLPAALPLILPLHGGAFLGDGLAYSFCEVRGRHALYAAIPACGSVQPAYEECLEGKIAEYDLTSMQPVATHRFFSPSFYGRFEVLVCLDDEVQVGVQDAWYQGRSVVQSVMSFPIAAPTRFSVLTVEGGIGATLAYDEEHDAFYYSGEFDNPVVRYDRRTRQLDRTVSQEFVRAWVNPVTLEPHRGSIAVHTAGIDPGRNRIYLTEWMQGRYAYALDLTTLRVVARYDAGGGGSLGATVDPERDRLYVSSMWGLDVFDLTTDDLIARKHTGFGNRPVILDRARGRLYLSSTAEGKIRIFDRDTLDLIGQIPIGFGSRYPHLSLDGKYLFASSASAHYYWDADTLVSPR